MNKLSTPFMSVLVLSATLLTPALALATDAIKSTRLRIGLGKHPRRRRICASEGESIQRVAHDNGAITCGIGKSRSYKNRQHVWCHDFRCHGS